MVFAINKDDETIVDATKGFKGTAKVSKLPKLPNYQLQITKSDALTSQVL